MAERYDIRRTIGRGGNGVVYEAWDTQLNRAVAVKRLVGVEGEVATQELVKEAEAMSAIQHPNIVGVFDFGTDEDGGFVVMELLEGLSLSRHIKEHGPFSVNELKLFIDQCLDALIAALDINLMHRDLKPSNIQIATSATGKMHAKLLDFGLAKIASQPSLQTVDQNNHVMGSIYAMAPEQFDRLPLDPRVDLYSFGCCIYYAGAGDYPFRGETMAEVMDAHLDGRYVPLDQIRNDLPVGLIDWVHRLLACDRDDRPADARAALAEFLLIDWTGFHRSGPVTLAPGAEKSVRAASEMTVTGTFLQTAAVRPRVPQTQAQAPVPANRTYGVTGRTPGAAPAGPAAGKQSPYLAWGLVGGTAVALAIVLMVVLGGGSGGSSGEGAAGDGPAVVAAETGMNEPVGGAGAGTSPLGGVAPNPWAGQPEYTVMVWDPFEAETLAPGWRVFKYDNAKGSTKLFQGKLELFVPPGKNAPPQRGTIVMQQPLATRGGFDSVYKNAQAKRLSFGYSRLFSNYGPPPAFNHVFVLGGSSPSLVSSGTGYAVTVIEGDRIALGRYGAERGGMGPSTPEGYRNFEVMGECQKFITPPNAAFTVRVDFEPATSRWTLYAVKAVMNPADLTKGHEVWSGVDETFTSESLGFSGFIFTHGVHPSERRFVRLDNLLILAGP